MAKAYLIKDCYATWNEEHGWDCQCEGKHPTLCSPIVDFIPCENCEGTGYITSVCDQGHYGHTEECHVCEGQGDIEYIDKEHLEQVRK